MNVWEAIGKATVCCVVIGVGTWAIIHRHVIAAALTGQPLPTPPASHTWHTKGFCCTKK